MIDIDPQAARDKIARQRFTMLSLLRLSGAAMVMFGFLCIGHRIAWFQGNLASAVGAIFASVGLIQTLVLPRILARAWRTPPGQ
ncbi:MAG: hypothetical protein ABI395_12950 [Sphingobium sp.]